MEPDNGGSWTVLPGGPSIEAGKHLDPRRALEGQVLRLHALLLFLVDDPQIKGRLMVVHEEVEIPAKDAIVHRTGHPLVLRLLAESHDAAEHQPQHARSEEHTSELQSQSNLVCRLLLEKKKKT